MAALRKPLQGVWNIVRFNWQFYVLSAAFVLTLLVISNYVVETIQAICYLLALLIIIPTVISLLVSLYVYDLSGLYELNWANEVAVTPGSTIINIHAGFDETSDLLQQQFKISKLIVFDFYDPVVHTEISIKRARKAYPSFPGTIPIKTTHIPCEDNSADLVFIIFSAHEIRDPAERILFFRELNRILKPTGHIIVMEHLRDIPNFVAYTIGFLHFYSKPSWFKTFAAAGLEVQKDQKINPFISKFTLLKYGTSS